MPTSNDLIAPDGSKCSRGDDFRKRLQGLLVDLDILGETLAAIHVQTALDCLGRVWTDKESIDKRSSELAAT